MKPLLLYAKKSFHASPAAVARRLAALVATEPAPSVSRAREWLAFAGQLEQAVLDHAGTTQAARITDGAARLFLDGLSCTPTTVAQAALIRAIEYVTPLLRDEPLEFRLPEGFAWYALDPKSYAMTAARWADAHAGESVCVIGLLSIGTALSAVVAEVLQRGGLPVAPRIVLRPEGHPFQRTATLPEDVPRAEAFVIVDEGPGLSGSSMAAVAEALEAQGVDAQRIFFFPGHGNGPGREASAEIRRWWTPERCWVTSVPEERATGHRLFGGFAAADATLATLGSLRFRRQQRMAEHGLSLKPITLAHGWLYLEGGGRPLTRADLSAGFITGTLAPYVTSAAQRAETLETFRQAIDRTSEALAAAGESTVFAARAAQETDGRLLAGDGRLQPAEWLRTPDGRILKCNATGTDCEHTWAGPQHLLWDVAGAIAEWEMSADDEALLLAVLAKDHAIAAPAFALAFHMAGYCCLGLARARQQGCAPSARRHEHRFRAALARMEALSA